MNAPADSTTPFAWPQRLEPGNAAKVAERVQTGEDAAMVLDMLAAGGLHREGWRSMAMVLDEPVATALRTALDADGSPGPGILGRVARVLPGMPRTAAVVLGHPQAAQWVEACNRDGVALAASVLRAGVGWPGERWKLALGTLGGLGASPLHDDRDGALAPWQEAILANVGAARLPSGWRAADAAAIDAGLPALLNRAWPRQQAFRSERTEPLPLWNRLMDAIGQTDIRAGAKDRARLRTRLLVGGFLVAPARRESKPRNGGGKAGSGAGSHGLGALWRTDGDGSDAWLAPSGMAPDRHGGVCDGTPGWPLAGAVLLDFLARAKGGTSVGARSGEEPVFLAVKAITQAMTGGGRADTAVACDIDARLPLGGRAGPSLRGLLALTQAVLLTLAPRGLTDAFRPKLEEALAAREALDGFADPKALGTLDRFLMQWLLRDDVNTTAPLEVRTATCLRLLAKGTKVDGEGYSLEGAMAGGLASLLLVDPKGTRQLAARRDETLLQALARTPELLAHVNVKHLCGLSAFPFPGEAGTGARAARRADGMPWTLANMEAWEDCVRERLGSDALDSVAWVVATGEVFRAGNAWVRGWIGGDQAAGWLARRMTHGAVQGGSGLRVPARAVKALFPILLRVLDARGVAPLLPEHRATVGAWLTACGKHPASTHAVVDALQGWRSASWRNTRLGDTDRHPALLFLAGGVSDCRSLYQAVERNVHSKKRSDDWRARHAGWLLDTWQAASQAAALHGGEGARRARRMV